ncbi:MAG: ATP-binding cassette domain-containing protein [Alicyclobacillus herbarius]|uniref:ATP-binding cassette domain-containing protein n=1 Tax=Alicyclobacillus herbarius TaxID=122960 RepID=UPI002357C359|nr:ATP-binding cassette domain-containing protein [Alicyclobacillus herbarius]MCL6633678.1 ATP-binding cassette domain-containing protein [Alicyclobacillus herbarius]
MPVVIRGLCVNPERDAGNTRPRLQNVNLDLPDKAITLVVGSTGAGKSTLLDALSGLVKPDAGSIVLDGAPLWERGRLNATVQQRLGVVFQSPESYLFASTVVQEFRYSLRPLRLPRAEVEQRTVKALADVGLGPDFLMASPLTLSGGQKRRVALATALAVKPDWLLLDEPTAGLDPSATTALMRWLTAWRDEAERGGMIIATHDLDALLPVADYVVVLGEGRVLHQGCAASLLHQPHILAAAGLCESQVLAIGQAAVSLGIPLGTDLTPEQLAASFIEWMHMRDEAPVRPPISPQPAPLDAGVHEAAGMRARETRSGADKEGFACDHGADAATPASVDMAPTESATVGGGTPWRQAARDLDPRAKWAACLVLSAGLLLQHSGLGYALGTLVVTAALWTSGISYRQWWRLVKPLLMLMVLSGMLSGIAVRSPDAWPHGAWHWSWVGFMPLQAWNTLWQGYRFFLVVALSVLLPTTTEPLRMQRGITEMLRPLRRIGLPSEAIALSASLILRFIPVLLAEFNRFARIARARARANPRRAGLRLRDLPAVGIPLLLSVLRLGDEFSEALEIRGYRLGKQRTESVQARWRRTDTVCVVAAMAAGTLMMGIRVLGL